MWHNDPFMLIAAPSIVEYGLLVLTSLTTWSGRGLSVESHEDPGSAALAGWDDVVDQAGAPIFYRSRYLAAYHEYPLADLDRLAYLVVRASAGGSPLAVVPVALHTSPDPLGRLRPIHPGIETGRALLSHVWHCYDTRIVGAVDRPEVTEAVLAAMAELAVLWQADWLGFVNVARGSGTAAALAAAGLPGAHLIDRFWADLTGLDSLDKYLARLARRGRSNLGRNARRAAECGMTADVVSGEEADLPEVAELCARTAARFGNPEFYPEKTFAGFVGALGQAVHVVQIRQHGRLVAVGVCFADDQRFHTWTCGVDYDVTGNASPYALLFAETVATAIRLGLPMFEGGRSNDAFKRRHGLERRQLDAHIVAV
jgi:CelD/BcsL family acetyltransferase involved in cellulose biosynthesis